MRVLVVFLFCWLGLVSVTWGQDPCDAVCGTWLTATGKAHVEIKKEGNHYTGYITWLRDPHDAKGQPLCDRNNDEEDLRKRPILGLPVLMNLRHKRKGCWEGGRIYDPEQGKTFDCRLELEGGNRLKVRGYIGTPVFGKTQYWKRVEKK